MVIICLIKAQAIRMGHVVVVKIDCLQAFSWFFGIGGERIQWMAYADDLLDLASLG